MKLGIGYSSWFFHIMFHISHSFECWICCFNLCMAVLFLLEICIGVEAKYADVCSRLTQETY